MRSMNPINHLSAKKGLKLSNERTTERVDRSAATFKSQIVSYKEKLTSARQNKVQPIHIPQNNHNPPAINSARNQRQNSEFFQFYSRPQQQLKNNLQQPFQKFSQSSHKPYKMNQSYEESRTKENDSDYQSSKLNYLQKKPINDFTPVNNFEPLKYEKPEEKETKLFSSYQELELQELKRKLKIAQQERKVERAELQKMKNCQRETEVEYQSIKFNFERISKEKAQIQENFQNYEKQVTSLRKEINEIRTENSESGITIRILETKLKDSEYIRNIKTNEINKLKENMKKISESSEEKELEFKTVAKENQFLSNQVSEEKKKIQKLNEQKRLLLDDFKKLDKVRAFVKNAQQSDFNRSEQIKLHIAYEVQLIEQNESYKQQLNRHQNDLELSKMQYHSLSSEIEKYNNEVELKIKRVQREKALLEEQLLAAKQETERIRKQMFAGYQEIIGNLKNQIIDLKEKNVNLSDRSEFKIQILKLQRDNKILNNRIEDLSQRNKELQENYHKAKSQRTISSEVSINSNNSETSINLFDGEFGSIIRTYESRGLDLNERIQEKQTIQGQLKKKIEKLEIDNQELKGNLKLLMKKEKSSSENTKNQIESIEFNLKKEMESLTRKISSLEDIIKRKNKEIGQKDSFMTRFLLSKGKEETEVERIMEQMSNYFK